MLLRTAAYFLDIPYQFDPLFHSQFVQAMLSLVWSATALVLTLFRQTVIAYALDGGCRVAGAGRCQAVSTSPKSAASSASSPSSGLAF